MATFHYRYMYVHTSAKIGICLCNNNVAWLQCACRGLAEICVLGFIHTRTSLMCSHNMHIIEMPRNGENR